MFCLRFGRHGHYGSLELDSMTCALIGTSVSWPPTIIMFPLLVIKQLAGSFVIWYRGPAPNLEHVAKASTCKLDLSRKLFVSSTHEAKAT